MSEKEKSHLETIKAAMNLLPEKKQEYIIGYAEGVIAASAAPVPELESSCMVKTILEKPKIFAKELREFLEADYKKSPNWRGYVYVEALSVRLSLVVKYLPEPVSFSILIKPMPIIFDVSSDDFLDLHTTPPNFLISL